MLFAVPGAFTPTCSRDHAPGFIKQAAAFKAKGVDTVACVSVNDAFVMRAWADSMGAGNDVLFLADGNGAFVIVCLLCVREGVCLLCFSCCPALRRRHNSPDPRARARARQKKPTNAPPPHTLHTGEFTKAMGLELDGSGFGLGQRSQRYALIAADGVIKVLSVESGPGLSCSAADEVLKVVEDAL